MANANVMDHLHRMAVFARVVEVGSFSGAARSLGVAKSAVSRHVGVLEDHLNVRLLNRTTRTLHLTEAGEEFYASVKSILAEADEAVRRARNVQGEMLGTLRMTMPVDFGRRFVLPHLIKIVEAWPRLDLRLVFQDNEVDLVANGIDLAIRIGRLPDSSLVARALGPVNGKVVASPAYLAEHGTPTRVEELKDHRWIVYSRMGPVNRVRLQSGKKVTEVSVNPRIEADSGAAMVDVARAGLGVTMMPSWFVKDDIEAGRLVHVLPEWGNVDRKVFAVYPARHLLASKIRHVIDTLAEAFAEPPW
ncbi:MAG: DNA-binding transcriptional LysR family regulator [Bradymonadia bacterium]|jgi:DNA-binding transcriptional LysR family regulator